MSQVCPPKPGIERICEVCGITFLVLISCLIFSGCMINIEKIEGRECKKKCEKKQKVEVDSTYFDKYGEIY